MNKALITRLSVLGLAVAAIVGCAETPRGAYGPVQSEPLTIDPAMQQREWEPTSALYANGDTVTWSTGFAYQPTGNANWQYYFTDPATFAVNLVTLPVTYFRDGTEVRYQGVVVPPSYTANPPLPSSPPTQVEYEPTTQPSE